MDKKIILALCIFGTTCFTVGLFIGLLVHEDRANKVQASTSARPPAESEEEDVAAGDPAPVEEEAEQESENPASETAATSATGW